MYNREFCDKSIDVTTIKSDGKIFSDDDIKKFNMIIKSLDSYVYLIDAYRIVVDCAEDLINLNPSTPNEFWKINKYLFNYINAVYIFKEMLNNFMSRKELRKIITKYKKDDTWFNIMCDYRNLIVHMFAIIKDIKYVKGNNQKILINIDELLTIAKNAKYEKFKKNLEVKSEYICENINGIRYLDLNILVSLANKDIKKIYNESLIDAYELYVKEAIKNLIEYIVFVEGNAKYTFLVNKELKDEIEPTFMLENFLMDIFNRFEKEHYMTNKIINDLKIMNYIYLFEKGCLIDEL